PLADPAVLRYGVKALLDPAAPLHIPLKADPRLWAFLVRFAARCTMPQWRRTMAALVPLNRAALDAYDELERDPGLGDRSRHGSIIAAFREPEQADALLKEFRHVRDAGLDLDYEAVDGDAVRAIAPVVTDRVV